MPFRTFVNTIALIRRSLGVERFDMCLPLVAALLLIASTTHAQSCQDAFAVEQEVRVSKSLKLPDETVLEAHHEQRVRAILADLSRAPRERWTDVIDIYFEARLRLISPALRNVVRRRVRGLKPRFANVDFIEGTERELLFPAAFADSPLPYITVAHEREHLLRAVVKSGSESGTGPVLYKFDPVSMYLEESHALGAEWDLARFMSSEEAAQLETLANMFGQRSRDRLFVRSVALSALKATSRADYIRRVRQVGRYTFVYSAKKVAVTYAVAGVVVGPAAAGIWGLCLFFR